MKQELHKFTFPFATTFLVLSFAKKPEDSLIKDVAFVISAFQNELNNNYLNSSAYTLVKSQIGLPVRVTTEFMEFLKLNIDYYKKGYSNFRPFTSNGVQIDNVLDFFSVIPADNTVVKKQDFKFDGTILAKYFVIEKVNEFLKEKQANNYLLSTDTVFSTRGRLIWNCSIAIEEDQSRKFPFKLKEGSAIFEPVTMSSKPLGTKFGSREKELEFNAAIIFGQNPIELKLKSLELGDLKTEYMLKQYCDENAVRITIFTKDGKNLDFTGF